MALFYLAALDFEYQNARAIGVGNEKIRLPELPIFPAPQPQPMPCIPHPLGTDALSAL